jgi:hypothetical protein
MRQPLEAHHLFLGILALQERVHELGADGDPEKRERPRALLMLVCGRRFTRKTNKGAD